MTKYTITLKGLWPSSGRTPSFILVITEFGRTVEVNGSLGPASGYGGHGIATTAFLIGGASRAAE